MQTIVSFIDRKTNLQICGSEIDLSSLEDLVLSPTDMFNYIWEEAVDNGVIRGNRNNYLIQLYNQQNHIINTYDSKDLTRIEQFKKNGGTKGKIVCLQSYKEFRNHKISQNASSFGSIHQ